MIRPRGRSGHGILLAFLPLLAAAWSGCEREWSESTVRGASLLLVTLDTCRPDMIGCYHEEGAALTPNLDSLATESVLFERAYCQAPSTLPSHASILTGLSPAAHGIHDNGVYFLGPEVETLAERLLDRGYRTAAFVSAFVLDHRFGLDQGFELYDDEMEEALRPGEAPTFPPGTDPERVWWLTRRFQPYQRPAESVVPRAAAWLRSVGDRPFFLWVHLFDPHEPYTPPPEWVRYYDPTYQGKADGNAEKFLLAWRKGKMGERDYDHMVARYRGELSYTDQWLGRLLTVVNEPRLRERTVVAVIGDHGEGLGEHGLFFEHNSLLYEELVRVPFLLRPAGRPIRGRRVAAPVRTVDLVPTVLELTGSPAPEDVDGRSLTPFWEDGGEEELPVYSEALCGRQALPVPVERRSLTVANWRLIRSTRRADGVKDLELYDLEADPWERMNHAVDRDSLAHALEGRLDAWLAQSARGGKSTGHALPLDEETRKKLKSLGYLR